MRGDQSLLRTALGSPTLVGGRLGVGPGRLMQALPYVDGLVREYLLFRGFARASQALAADAAADRGCGFQADALARLVFGRLIPQRDGAALVELLAFLRARLFRHLDAGLDAAVRRMQARGALRRRL
jgi:hypothetical protein